MLVWYLRIPQGNVKLLHNILVYKNLLFALLILKIPHIKFHPVDNIVSFLL